MLLYRLPWFSRIWIIQEIALASRAVVSYGKFHLEWSDLLKSFHIMNRLSSRNNTWTNHHAPGTLNMYKILKFCEVARRQSSRTTYMYVLILGRDFKATDPRDKIIGFHSIVEKEEMFGISPFKPDYTISISKLYHRFAVHLVDITCGQALLSFAGLHRRGTALSESNVPSWVADWTGQSILQGGKVIATMRPVTYKASGMLPPAIMLMAPSPNEDPDVMSMEGIEFDRIVNTTNALELAEGGSDEQEQFPLWYLQAVTAMHHIKDTRHPTQRRYNDIDDAFIRTLLMDDLYTGGNLIPNISPLLHLKPTIRQMLNPLVFPISSILKKKPKLPRRC